MKAIEVARYLISKIYENTNLKLPSEKSLNIKFNLHRTTIREGFSILKRLGLIKSIKGKGHFPSQNAKQFLRIILLSNTWFDSVKRNKVKNNLVIKNIKEKLKIDKNKILIFKSYYYENKELIKISFNILLDRSLSSKNSITDNIDWLEQASCNDIVISRIEHEMKFINFNNDLLTKGDYKLLDFTFIKDMPIIISKFIKESDDLYEMNLIFIPKSKISLLFSIPYIRP